MDTYLFLCFVHERTYGNKCVPLDLGAALMIYPSFKLVIMYIIHNKSAVFPQMKP